MKIVKLRPLFFSSILILSCLIRPSIADVTLHYTAADSATVIQISSGKAKISQASSDGGLVFDSDTDQLLALDADRQQYIDFDQLMEQVDQVQDKVATMMQQSMQGMSAEEQAMMTKMMGGLMGKAKQRTPTQADDEADITPTNNTEVINGFRCEQVVVTRSGRQEDWCVAKPEQLGVSEEDHAVMLKLMQRTRSLGQKAKRFAPANLSDGLPNTMPSALQGIPVKVGGEHPSRLSAVNQEAINPDTFSIPAGFKPVELPVR